MHCPKTGSSLFQVQAIRIGSLVPGAGHRRKKDWGEKHREEGPNVMANWELLLWDRHQAFRPCVLFLENVPAETL